MSSLYLSDIVLYIYMWRVQLLPYICMLDIPSWFLGPIYERITCHPIQRKHCFVLVTEWTKKWSSLSSNNCSCIRSLVQRTWLNGGRNMLLKHCYQSKLRGFDWLTSTAELNLDNKITLCLVVEMRQSSTLCHVHFFRGIRFIKRFLLKQFIRASVLNIRLIIINGYLYSGIRSWLLLVNWNNEWFHHNVNIFGAYVYRVPRLS